MVRLIYIGNHQPMSNFKEFETYASKTTVTDGLGSDFYHCIK